MWGGIRKKSRTSQGGGSYEISHVFSDVERDIYKKYKRPTNNTLHKLPSLFSKI